MSVKKYKVGLTFGAFCPLHFGHIRLLIQAKEHCSRLIVCASDDEYIKKHKGYTPPISVEERLKHLMILNIIDHADLQTLTFGKKEAVEKYKPDVLLVSDDWNKDNYSGEGLGVPVVYLPHTPNISSTILRKKISLE